MFSVRVSPSEAQLDALAARSSPYRVEHERSRAMAWDASRRRPRDLRSVERYLREQYAAEVELEDHEQRQLAEDGTPKMTARAVAYIFGDPQSTQAHDPDEALTFYQFPFQATLDQFARGDARQRDIAGSSSTSPLVVALPGTVLSGKVFPAEPSPSRSDV